ncbi:MAG: geranylgeranylglyceryl/heptaprenylglyceryl phosphate synthase, partial [Chitinophagaceae bacterium]
MKMPVYTSLLKKKENGKKSLAVLIDPDNVSADFLDPIIQLSQEAEVDYFFVGGSLVVSDHLDECILFIKKHCSIPVLLFPGSASQISRHADALLYLSL